MRKIYTIILALSAIVSSATAQNMYDAINFSRNEYFGTARSAALGNAVTALGGDLGTIGINPAGSAVANYGQFTFTLGSSTSVANASFSVFGDGNTDNMNSSNRTNVLIPNIGISMVVNTGRRTGLKSFSLALVSNQTAQYNSFINGRGRNGFTSKVGELAAAANGMDPYMLAKYDSFQNSNAAWDILTGYQGGLISEFGSNLDYVGVTQGIGTRPDGSNYTYVLGDLDQMSITNKTGTKDDLVLNLGLNFSDKLFLGFNLGLPTAVYRYSEAFYETAVNPDKFVITFNGENGNTYDVNFSQANFGYQYLADIDGIYAKIGAIYVNNGLRLGAAIQTPTYYTISEKWLYNAGVKYTDSYYNASQESPQGDYTYSLSSPYVANFGAAYTFGNKGFISVDYELMDYSVMRFRDIDYDYMAQDSFRDLNDANRLFAGTSTNLRIGAELILLPQLALRAGYGLLTSPEKYYLDNGGNKITVDDYLADYGDYFSHKRQLGVARYYDEKTTKYSLGVGYSSYGSFFADLTGVMTQYPVSSFAPYYEYVNYDSAGEEKNFYMPRITTERNLFNVVLTLGWRF